MTIRYIYYGRDSERSEHSMDQAIERAERIRRYGGEELVPFSTTRPLSWPSSGPAPAVLPAGPLRFPWIGVYCDGQLVADVSDASYSDEGWDPTGAEDMAAADPRRDWTIQCVSSHEFVYRRCAPRWWVLIGQHDR